MGLGFFQSKSKSRPYIELAPHIDCLFVSLNDVFDDRQAQAGASLGARATTIDSVKAIEEVSDVFLADSNAIISHFDQNIIIHIIEADFDFYIVSSLIQGIDILVIKYLSNTFPITFYLVSSISPFLKN